VHVTLDHTLGLVVDNSHLIVDKLLDYAHVTLTHSLMIVDDFHPFQQADDKPVEYCPLELTHSSEVEYFADTPH
jgi:hypothetical protein